MVQTVPTRGRWLFAAGTLALLFATALSAYRRWMTPPTPDPFSALVFFDPNFARPIDPERDRMEEIAIRSSMQVTGLKATQYQARAERVGNEWHVFVGQLAAMPGGFCYVILSIRGEVISIQGGA